MDERTRVLRNVCEPIGANVYFAPEAHQRYRDLGLNGSSGYFCSRGASLGRAPGLVIASAFGVFSPALVVPAVEAGWAQTDVPAMLQARHDGAVASLRRLLGEPDVGQIERAVSLLRRGMADAEHAGHPLYSGLMSMPEPDEPLGRLWRACDLLREHRGDSHIAVWTQHGLRPIEIQLMSELHMGIPLKSYSRTRGYSDYEMDAALDGMRRKGWMEGDDFSAAGRALRDRIEAETDDMETGIVERIGDDLDELVGLLRPWAGAITAVGIQGGGYPGSTGAIGRMGAGRT